MDECQARHQGKGGMHARRGRGAGTLWMRLHAAFCLLLVPTSASSDASMRFRSRAAASSASSSLDNWFPWSWFGLTTLAQEGNGDAAFPLLVHAPGDDELADEAADNSPLPEVSPRAPREEVSLLAPDRNVAAVGRSFPMRVRSTQGRYPAGATPQSNADDSDLPVVQRWRVNRKASSPVSLRSRPSTAQQFDEEPENMHDQSRADAAPVQSSSASLASPPSMITAQLGAKGSGANDVRKYEGGVVADMMHSCLSFTAWLKSQQVAGDSLEHVFKSSCLKGGSSTARITSMCRDLGCAIANLGLRGPIWEANLVCETVVRTFKASGIGASPLTG